MNMVLWRGVCPARPSLCYATDTRILQVCLRSEGPGLLGGRVGYHGDQETEDGDSCTNVRHNEQKDGTRYKYISRVEVLKYTKY